jgi:ribosomal protein S18 acetylase RimI-like enzyme
MYFMKTQTLFRPATIDDCYKIAQLFSMASDGVANYMWSTLTKDYPGLTPIEIGSKRYANDQSVFSYKSCIVAERDGEVIGMMATYPIEEASESNSKATTELKELSDEPDILAPYSMEAPGTWYICALALFPEFRGQGLGTQFLSIARQQAQEKGFQELSLLCFEQNTGAMKLYQRNGFKVIDRAAIVPHKLIHCTGDVLLMTTPASVA